MALAWLWPGPGRVYSSYMQTEGEFPPYATTEEYSIKSADYQGGNVRTLQGCTKTVQAIDVGDCGIKITFGHLLVGRADGSRLHRIAAIDRAFASNLSTVSDAVWSPSGKRFAIGTSNGEVGGIVTLRTDGSDFQGVAAAASARSTP